MDYITPLLKETLYQLPVSFTIDFGVILLVYKALNNLLLPTLEISFHFMFQPCNALLLNVPYVSHKSTIEASLCFYACELVNTLPLDITTASSLCIFKIKLTTYPLNNCIPGGFFNFYSKHYCFIDVILSLAKLYSLLTILLLLL